MIYTCSRCANSCFEEECCHPDCSSPLSEIKETIDKLQKELTHGLNNLLEDKCFATMVDLVSFVVARYKHNEKVIKPMLVWTGLFLSLLGLITL